MGTPEALELYMKIMKIRPLWGVGPNIGLLSGKLNARCMRVVSDGGSKCYILGG